MKKGYKKLLIFEIILFLVLILNSFIVNILNRFTILFFLVGLILIFKFIFGIEKERKRYIKDIIFEILIIYLVSFILFYILGIFTGFYKNANYLTLYGIKEIILPLILFIILKEYLRSIIIVKSEGSKLLYFYTCILFILFDLTNVISYSNLTTKGEIFNFIALSILPAISNNIVAIYISHKSNYKINIFWLLIAELYVYILPIIPNTGNYILSIIKVIFPFIILNNIKNFFDKEKDDYVEREYNKKQIFLVIFASVLIVIIVYFTSGIFKYYAVAIATGSMAPNVNVGDVVIIEKVDNNYEKLEIGQIIAYEHGNVMVVHRIVNIIEDRGKYYFYTKGDANDNMDNYVIEEEMIIGVVNKKIPYIGMPTVWLNKL